MLNNLSWSERISLVRDAFRGVYPYPSEAQPVEPASSWWVDEVYEDHVIVTGDGIAYSVLFTVDDEGVVTFAPSDEWVKVERQWVELAQMGLLIPIADFVEKVDASGVVKGIEVWYAGLFQDKHGKLVTVTDADLDEYEASFKAGVVGQELPIYVGHPPLAIRAEEPAAAWIKDVYTKVVDGVKKLLWDIDLTALGKKVLSEKLYKYLSPSVQLDEKVITGGGFCTMPAIKGNPPIEYAFSERQFLKPQEVQKMSLIEQVKQALRELFQREPELLAEFSQVKTETGGEDEMTDEERKALEAEIRAGIEAEFAQKAQTVADLTESITTEVRAQVEAEFVEKAKREADLSEFVQGLSEGGLSTPPDEVTATLMLLDEDQLAAVKTILMAKMVDFSERGRKGDGAKVEQLPKAVAIALRQFVAGKEEVKAAVESFFAANDLDVAEFDLSEFLPKE